MKIVDSAQMAGIDRRAQNDFGIPPLLLMEDAGTGAYRLLDRIWDATGPAVFVAGKGNNGGDVLVMARQCALAGKRNIVVVMAGGDPPKDSPPGINLRICRSMGVEIADLPAGRKAVKRAGWIIDGLLGTGLSGAARAPIDQVIAEINRANGTTVSIDIPSGIGDGFRRGYPAVQADHTLTIGLPKRCLYLPRARKNCGQIHVVSSVFPEELVQDEELSGELLEWDDGLIRPLPDDTYKTQRGHLAVFAGSKGTTGAAWLCATAAARSRAGLVTLFTDPALYDSFVTKFNSVMVRSESESFEPDRYSCLAVGPGWGLSERRRKQLEKLLALPHAGVLDADGITLLAEMPKPLSFKTEWVLTPHPGEFARLSGSTIDELLDDPLPPLLAMSADLKAVIVLKGHCTIIAMPRGAYRILDGMNPALATGGSGDLLTGIIAGLLTSGHTAEESACLGVLLHHRIGRSAFAEKGLFLAEDLMPYISAVFKD